jgi:hypothetical protein
MPKTIPCTLWEPNGCEWDFEVTFTEERGVDATIEKIGRVFVDTKGRVWTVGGDEWSDVTIDVPALGSDTYDSWARTTNGDSPDLRGGTVKVSYSGTDASGHAFSGSVTAKLARSP